MSFILTSVDGTISESNSVLVLLNKSPFPSERTVLNLSTKNNIVSIK